MRACAKRWEKEATRLGKHSRCAAGASLTPESGTCGVSSVGTSKMRACVYRKRSAPGGTERKTTQVRCESEHQRSCFARECSENTPSCQTTTSTPSRRVRTSQPRCRQPARRQQDQQGTGTRRASPAPPRSPPSRSAPPPWPRLPAPASKT